MPVKEDIFGKFTDPDTGVISEVKRWTLSSENAEVEIISYGATITAIRVPDKNGKLQDVTMGFDNMEGYLGSGNPYFGAMIGRVANRIAEGKFKVNGKEYNVSKNRGKFHLHGGNRGFDKRIWSGETDNIKNRVTLSLLSADGEEGYPGSMISHVTYRLIDQSLHVDMLATCTKTTPISLTNHAYFNLAGHNAGKDGLYDHVVTINADNITEVDGDAIPTGKLLKVGGTKFDLRSPKRLGDVMEFDHNFCVNVPQQQQNSTIFVARVEHPESGRVLEVYSNQPGVQFYTANFIPEKGLPGKLNASYTKHGAFCLETQSYPDSVNQPNFPNSLLKPGDTYVHNVVYKFSCCK